MTQEIQQTLLDLSQKKLFPELTNELNSELAKLSLSLSEQEKANVFVNCDGIMAKLNSRLSQLKSTLLK